jgi:peptidoglycan/xylan/chitin deacetylase (PgdA/CDA1 family)
MRVAVEGSVLLLLLGVSLPAADTGPVRYVGKTKYLNNSRAVVTHNIDDSTKYVASVLDAMDKYGIKSTIFASTDEDPSPEDRFLTQLMVKDLWPRLRQAIDNGHEVGCHSQTHPCPRPETEANCQAAYTEAEVAGSRDQILKHTQQPYVWTWCYPCGTCANLESVQKKIAGAGFIVARNYPDENHDGHIVPNLQTWAANPFNAAYTQVVQKRGGAAKSERLDLNLLNGKFDEVYSLAGIYNFMSHPQWLDYGPDGFYEKHMAHIGRRPDVWYVPMGPLYAYKTILERTDVRLLSRKKNNTRFAVSNHLDRKIYRGSITLQFSAPPGTVILSNGTALPERNQGLTDRWDREYLRLDGDRLYVTVLSNTTLDFRSPPKQVQKPQKETSAGKE